jgi:ethanolamine utilization protein EutP (predicted NTPase)
MKRTGARWAPNWQDWLKSARVCEQSLTYFERKAQVKRLNAKQAEADVLGHLRKAFHNLSLAIHAPLFSRTASLIQKADIPLINLVCHVRISLS